MTTAASSTEASTDMSSHATPQVSEGLADLVKAFDAFKSDIGYGIDWDEQKISAFKARLAEVESENSRLRTDAEDIVILAQQLKEENEELRAELAKAKVSSMMEETQKLTTVAYEFDKEMVDAKLADAERAMAEVANFKERLAELEDNNQALTEMLNESQESYRQLRELHIMEHSGRNSQPRTTMFVNEHSTAVSERATNRRPDEESGNADNSSGQETAVSEFEPSNSRRQAKLDASPNGVRDSKHGPGLSLEDPIEVADALSSVAGHSEAGIVAVAVRMLRDYSKQQGELEEERYLKESMQKELAELNDLVNAETFKAPSAWAEREVKYKQDKRRWEEEVKQLQLELESSRSELEVIRTSLGTNTLEKQIEDLEMQLLESEKQRNALQASLHEMQIISRSGAGEYSSTGMEPYHGPESDGGVQLVVEKLEESSTEKRKSSAHAIATESLMTESGAYLSAMNGQSIDRSGQGSVQGPRREVIASNTKLAMTGPYSYQLDVTQSELRKIEAEKYLLYKEIENLKRPASVTAAAPTSELQLLLRTSEAESKTELALLTAGFDLEHAQQIAILESQRQSNLEKQSFCPSDGDLEVLQQEYRIIEHKMRDLASSSLPNWKEEIHYESERKEGVVQFVPTPIIDIIEGSKNSSDSVSPSVVVFDEDKVNSRIEELVSRISTLESVLKDNQLTKSHLEAILDAKIAEEKRLKEKSDIVAPVRLNFNIDALEESTGNRNTKSLAEIGEISASLKTRGKFDGIENEATFGSGFEFNDMADLQRVKVALETQVQLLQRQLQKSQESLALATHERNMIQDSVDECIESGDLERLSQIKETTQKRSSSALSKVRRFKFSLRKKAKEDALSSAAVADGTSTKITSGSEGENNVASSIVLNEEDPLPCEHGEPTKALEGMGDDDIEEHLEHVIQQMEVELEAVQEENKMLMEELVNTKVHSAEVEGDLLEARRSLLRARETQARLLQQMRDSQDSLTPRESPGVSNDNKVDYSQHYSPPKRLQLSK